VLFLLVLNFLNMRVHVPTLLALLCIVLLSVIGTQARSAHARFHGNPKVAPKPVRPVKVPVHAAPVQYSPTMAYHEEPNRPPMPLWQAQWDVEDYHVSGGGYDTELNNVISNALTYAAASTAANNSLWVFDIDETSLSGYTEMLSTGLGSYVPKLNHEWVLNSSAPAILPTLTLYQEVVAQGFKVVFYYWSK